MQLLTLKDFQYVLLKLLKLDVILIDIQLLEDHFQKLREQDNVVLNEDDDEAAWEGWDVESDSSEDESDGWLDVPDDGEDLHISDSEDEADKVAKSADNPTAAAPMARISTLATTKVSRYSVLCVDTKLILFYFISDPYSC